MSWVQHRASQESDRTGTNQSHFFCHMRHHHSCPNIIHGFLRIGTDWTSPFLNWFSSLASSSIIASACSVVCLVLIWLFPGSWWVWGSAVLRCDGQRLGVLSEALCQMHLWELWHLTCLVLATHQRGLAELLGDHQNGCEVRNHLEAIIKKNR